MAPPIHHEVVDRPHEVVVFRSEPDERAAHERCLAEDQGSLEILASQSGERVWLRVGGHAGEIALPERERDLGAHDLKWLGQPFPQERSAQRRMAGNERVPRAVKGSSVERAAKAIAYLVQQHAAAGRRDRVQQHEALHRRERVGVSDVFRQRHASSSSARSSATMASDDASTPGSAAGVDAARPIACSAPRSATAKRAIEPAESA